MRGHSEVKDRMKKQKEAKATAKAADIKKAGGKPAQKMQPRPVGAKGAKR